MTTASTSLETEPEDLGKDFDIVNLCTEIPNLFYNLMVAYINSNGENAAIILQRLGPLVERLKKDINAIKFTLPPNKGGVAETDFEDLSLQDQMISVFRKQEMAIEELYAHLVDVAKTDNMQSRPAKERVHIIRSQIKPAIVALQKSCMAEIATTLKNVIQPADQN